LQAGDGSGQPLIHRLTEGVLPVWPTGSNLIEKDDMRKSLEWWGEIKKRQKLTTTAFSN
jgi:hypothetical protein